MVIVMVMLMTGRMRMRVAASRGMVGAATIGRQSRRT